MNKMTMEMHSYKHIINKQMKNAVCIFMLIGILSNKKDIYDIIEMCKSRFNNINDFFSPTENKHHFSPTEFQQRNKTSNDSTEHKKSCKYLNI
jgi:hypothetical protein